VNSTPVRLLMPGAVKLIRSRQRFYIDLRG
jgi:hypothetical protein